MSRQPRFEVVRTGAGWHARFRAANGQVVWTTEVYTRRKAAERAVLLICDRDGFYLSPHQDWPEVAWSVLLIEVREVDER